MVNPLLLLLGKVYSNFKLPVSNYQHVEFNIVNRTNDNIILIILDDFGINDINLMKKYNISEGIEELEKTSVIFNNAYAGHATCTPSRAALLSGKDPSSFGFEFTSHPMVLDFFLSTNPVNKLNYSSLFTNPWNKNIPNVKLISEELKEQGYYNYLIGKWHLGESEGFRPLEKGYDNSLNFWLGASLYGYDNIVSADLDHLYEKSLEVLLPYGVSFNNGKLFKPNKYMTDYFTDNALKVLDSNGFFLTLAYSAPHNPYQALKEDYESIEHEDNNMRIYLAMLKSIDRGIKKIIDKLKELGKYDNTMIIFTSDNGAPPLMKTGSNLPYKGYKCSFYEGGIRTPLMISYPKKFKPLVVEERISHLDLYEIIKTKEIKIKERPLFYRSGFYKTLIYKNYKISEYENDKSEVITKLYDLISDKYEKNEIKNDKLKKHLLKKLHKIQRPNPIWYGPTTIQIQIENEEILQWTI